MATLEEKLERMGRTADDLAGAISGQPQDVLARRPTDGGWSATEIVCHFRDVEEFYLNRIQIILANQEPNLTVIDADRWAEERQYRRNDVTEALAVFRIRRQETLKFLNSLAPEQWDRVGLHPLRGRITVRGIVHSMAKHDGSHLDQLKRALAGQP